MAQIDLTCRLINTVSARSIAALGLSLAIILGSAETRAARRDPNCLEKLRRDRVRILEKFGKLQNYKTYTPQKAAKLHAEVEQYLLAVGHVLENFNVEIFLEEQLAKIVTVKGQRMALAKVLEPSFKSRHLPSYEQLANHLRDAGLGHLPVRKIRDAMDRSFRVWRTKLVFDETGTTTYNALAKAFTEKMGIGEFSMQLGLLGKNEWEAFFESEKGKGIFNPSMPGLMADFFSSVEAHEAVHMVVETYAARGHESPYAVWMKVQKRYKKTGAIGSRQKRALAEASDPISDGDYYRTELYLDEYPAHVIQASYLNVQLSKALRARFQETIDSVRKVEIKDELEDAYGEYLRSGQVEWRGYADQTKRVFESFLAEKASDGRTHISKLLTEMNQYMNWVDLINDGGTSAVHEARLMLDEAIAEAKRAGHRGLHPKAGDPIQILPDVFLGVKGYRIEVQVPIDVLKPDGKWERVPRGATVNFRFTNDGRVSRSITPDKLDKLIKRMDWIAEMATTSKIRTDEYAAFLDKTGELADYTFADVFTIKQIHTRVRQDTREIMERIRAGK